MREVADMIPFSSLVELNPKTPLESDSSQVPFIGMDDVSEDAGLKRLSMRPRRDLLSGLCTFRDGDILIAKITPCLENGKGAFVQGLGGRIGVGSTEFHVARPRRGIDPRYVYHWIRYPGFRHAAAASMTGSAGQRRVPVSFFEKYWVPVHTYFEQRRIAAILDCADEQINAAEKLMNKQIAIKRGLLQLLCSSHYSSDKLMRLSDISLLITSGSRGWAQYYSENGALFVRIGNLTREHLSLRFQDCVFVTVPKTREARRSALQPGDLLISITADLGIVGVAPLDLGEAYINQHIALVRVSQDVNPRWVGHMVASDLGQRQFRIANDSGAKAGLNLPSIGRIVVPLPQRPTQDETAHLLDEQDTMIRNHRMELEKLRLLRQGLMHDLLMSQM